MANTITTSQILHKPDEIPVTIYGYTIPGLADHDGYIKVGYTQGDVSERINEQTSQPALKTKLLFKESAVRDDGTFFTDKAVHAELKKNGYIQMNEGEDRNEWFNAPAEVIIRIIHSLREGKKYTKGRNKDFSMREEQKMAVEKTAEYFTRMAEKDPSRPPKFLWNAKMRFGKTFAAYQLAKKMGFKKILILTFKPAVESAWSEDLQEHRDFEGWQFVSDKEAKYSKNTFDSDYKSCDQSKPIVVFGSFQNLLGATESGGIKPKNEFIHATNWDIIIFDEYHFGAWRENAQKLFQKTDEEAEAEFDPESYQKDEAGDAINESWIDITTNHYLYLSGTPFRSLYTGEFLEDEIFSWTYSDEQKAKEACKEKHPNPYETLPRMLMLTYKVPEEICEIAKDGEFDEFDLNEFFKAETEGKVSRFVHEEYVQKWLELIQGKGNIVEGLKLGSEKPPMPFSDTILKNSLSHTVWFLPSVASCHAMARLLRLNANKFFDDYKIIVCAGTEAGIGLDALRPVKAAMENPLNTKTITLSCGKLMTGVTVSPWSGIFMLRNLKSPETYFQSAFRVQSPWTMKKDNGDTAILKYDCYIFDFALNRALRQISEYSCRLNTKESNPEAKVKEFMNFLPVLAFDGASMNYLSAQDVLDITYAGTSATLLAKRWQTALLVHVDNDTLKRLLANKAALDALMNVEGFRSLNQDIIETIINKSDALKKAKKNDEDKSKNDKKEMTKEEKEIKSLRKQVQENLLKLAARIPSFMYLTDYREQTIRDVITQIEPELFKKVTGLTVADFEILCEDIKLFDPEKMNQGIFGFRRYEDSSLNYTGIDMHEGESVGGWDTVLLRKEYDELYAGQQASLTMRSAVTSAAKKTYKPKTDETETSINAKVPTQQKIILEAENKHDVKTPENINVGSKVIHKTFGEGFVTFLDEKDGKIRVKFAAGEKIFAYPFAFELGFMKKVTDEG